MVPSEEEETNRRRCAPVARKPRPYKKAGDAATAIRSPRGLFDAPCAASVVCGADDRLAQADPLAAKSLV
jgi:hypothetical protein